MTIGSNAVSRAALAAFLVLGIASSPAYAMKVKVVASGDLSKASITPEQAGVTYGSSLGLGGGALGSVGIGSLLGLEFGALYRTSKNKATLSTIDVVTTTKAIEIPVMLRANFAILSVGAGAYYDMAQGDIETEILGVKDTDTYAENNIEKNGYGLVFGAGIDLPLGPMFGLVLDARYKMDLKDRDKDTPDTFKLSGLQALAGLRIGLGK